MTPPTIIPPSSYWPASYQGGPYSGNQNHAVYGGLPQAGLLNGFDPETLAQILQLIQIAQEQKRFQPTSGAFPYAASAPLKEAEKLKGTKFPIRVKLCQTDEDCHKGAHEVFRVDAESSIAELRQYLRRQFKALSELNSAGKANLKGACWGEEDRIVKIKAMYTDSNHWDVSSDVVSETMLTEQNCRDTLDMLKKRGGHDFLCVVIGPPAGSCYPE